MLLKAFAIMALLLMGGVHIKAQQHRSGKQTSLEQAFADARREFANFEKAHGHFVTLIDHKIYPNTGHNIHYERPEPFLEDVATFMAKVKLHNRLI